MDTPASPPAPGPLCDILLTLGRTVVLELDQALQVTGVRNASLLDEWREAAAAASADRPAGLRALLEELMAGMRARELERQVGQGLSAVTAAGLYLGVGTLHAPRGGGGGRHVALSLHRLAPEAFVLVLRDITALTDVQHSLGETQASLDAAMAALRAPPQGLRLFLSSALTSISAIRATIRLPARDQEALHDKLARLHAAVAQLGREAQELHLAPVHDACQALLHRLSALLEHEELTGDALLPLATLVDRIAGSASTLWRIEEQRYTQPVDPRSGPRRQLDWTFASARRWASFLRHRGEEVGVQVTLQMDGAANVPRSLRASVDELLQHMLRNAVEHGIEPPEERVMAQKPAGGKVTVKFERRGDTQLRMTVHDDGRGRGLGLTYLRKSVAKLGGEIAVAAKPEQYTQFVIDLPLAASGESTAASQ